MIKIKSIVYAYVLLNIVHILKHMFNGFKKSGLFFLQNMFLFSFEKLVEIMYYTPLWERINLGLECTGIIVLIGFKLYFVPLAFQYSRWMGKNGFASLFPILVSDRKVL